MLWKQTECEACDHRLCMKRERERKDEMEWEGMNRDWHHVVASTHDLWFKRNSFSCCKLSDGTIDGSASRFVSPSHETWKRDDQSMRFTGRMRRDWLRRRFFCWRSVCRRMRGERSVDLSASCATSFPFYVLHFFVPFFTGKKEEDFYDSGTSSGLYLLYMGLSFHSSPTHFTQRRKNSSFDGRQHEWRRCIARSHSFYFFFTAF